MKFIGTVIKGHEVGGKFGIATANLAVEEDLDIEEGVYLVEVENEEGSVYEGLLHYGQRKTFGSDISIEVHLLSFDQNLYSEKISVQVLKFLRAVQKFENADSLFTQIEKDIVHAEKYFLRRRIRDLWRTVRAEEQQELANKAIEKITSLDLFQSAEVVLAYAPQEGREILFVEKLWKTNTEKKWYFPRIEEGQMQFYLVEGWEDLEEGEYGILEPKDCHLDQGREILSNKRFLADARNDNVFVLVPAVAVDLDKHRLGRGGGFYDRFLATTESQTVSVVPAFALLEKIPVESHDQDLDHIIVV